MITLQLLVALLGRGVKDNTACFGALIAGDWAMDRCFRKRPLLNYSFLVVLFMISISLSKYRVSFFESLA